MLGNDKELPVSITTTSGPAGVQGVSMVGTTLINPTPIFGKKRHDLHPMGQNLKVSGGLIVPVDVHIGPSTLPGRATMGPFRTDPEKLWEWEGIASVWLVDRNPTVGSNRLTQRTSRNSKICGRRRRGACTETAESYFWTVWDTGCKFSSTAA